jgi:hypothetical protein
LRGRIDWGNRKLRLRHLGRIGGSRLDGGGLLLSRKLKGKRQQAKASRQRRGKNKKN